jgi:hypothetical protein
MTTAAESTRPVLAVRYREAVPPRWEEIENTAMARLRTPRHSFSPAFRENCSSTIRGSSTRADHGFTRNYYRENREQWHR